MTSAGTTVEFRPRKIRWVAGIAAGAVVVLFTVLSFGLHGSTGFDNSGQFQRGDQSAMIGLGVLIGLGILAFCRPRVRADAEGITIRNVVGGYRLPWSVVRAVRFDRNSPWAILDLQDDEQVSVHALQAADKEYAVEGVRALRILFAAATGEPGRVANSRPRPDALLETAASPSAKEEPAGSHPDAPGVRVRSPSPGD